ncbi:hypothetical protein L1887_48915 [Cichorium endivia]|nr:hypothetical protein L1887_48915 [Cichorium endivia]
MVRGQIVKERRGGEVAEPVFVGMCSGCGADKDEREGSVGVEEEGVGGGEGCGAGEVAGRVGGECEPGCGSRACIGDSDVPVLCVRGMVGMQCDIRTGVRRELSKRRGERRHVCPVTHHVGAREGEADVARCGSAQLGRRAVEIEPLNHQPVPSRTACCARVDYTKIEHAVRGIVDRHGGYGGLRASERVVRELPAARILDARPCRSRPHVVELPHDQAAVALAACSSAAVHGNLVGYEQSVVKLARLGPTPQQCTAILARLVRIGKPTSARLPLAAAFLRRRQRGS